MVHGDTTLHTIVALGELTHYLECKKIYAHPIGKGTKYLFIHSPWEGISSNCLSQSAQTGNPFEGVTQTQTGYGSVKSHVNILSNASYCKHNKHR